VTRENLSILRPAKSDRLAHWIAGLRVAVAPFEPWAKPLVVLAWLLAAAAFFWKLSTIGIAVGLFYHPEHADAPVWRASIDASTQAAVWGLGTAVISSALLMVRMKGFAALAVIAVWAPLALWCAITLL